MVTIEALFLACMLAANQEAPPQACRSLARATALQFKSELQEVDRVEQRIASVMPPKLRTVASFLSALHTGSIYVPIYQKEF